MKRWLREPLFHFMLLGAMLFAISQWVQPARGPAASSLQIQLSLDQLSQIALVFQSQFGREPTDEEFRHLIELKVQEEILYREALALGLDKDDSIVKRRMAQKMQFLAEDVAASREPTSTELKSWFQENGEKFAMPGRISFRHLYFSPDRRGKQTRADAARALARQETRSADRFMFADHYRDRTPEDLSKEFGPQFVQALQKLPTGSWQGPVESGYGWHLVYVDTLVPGRVPAFEEVEGEVKTAWLGEQKKLAWEKAYRDMRARYTVMLPGSPSPTVAGAKSP